jgi:hypothetical protein
MEHKDCVKGVTVKKKMPIRKIMKLEGIESQVVEM